MTKLKLCLCISGGLLFVCLVCISFANVSESDISNGIGEVDLKNLNELTDEENHEGFGRKVLSHDEVTNWISRINLSNNSPDSVIHGRQKRNINGHEHQHLLHPDHEGSEVRGEENGDEEDCDCGEDIKCTFENGKQTCDCPTGKAQKDGKCAELNCNEDACNGKGACISDEGGKFQKCECKSGWKGDYCQEVNCVPECKDPEECREFQSDQVKCQCKEGYSNDTLLGHCTKCDCGKNGNCAINNGTKDCQCDDKYQWNKQDAGICVVCDCGVGTCSLKNDSTKDCDCGDNYKIIDGGCEDVCEPSPCLNGGRCTFNKTSQNFQCNCLEGFEGGNCENITSCVDSLKDACGSAKCEFNKITKSGYCTCDDKGSYFNYNEKKCQKVNDFCALRTCRLANEVCKNNACVCKDNFKRNETTNECIPDFCQNHKCKSPLTCHATDVSYECRCKDGQYFNGDKCLVSTCVPGKSTCLQKCDTKTQKCKCYASYTGNETHCVLKQNLQECDHATCSSGKCIKEGERQKCECPYGMSEDRQSCLGPCVNGNTTVENICPSMKCVEGGTFKCVCSEKYKYDKNGITCLLRKRCESDDTEAHSECSKIKGYCELANNNEGYTCKCRTGYEQDDLGVCTAKCALKTNIENCEPYEKTCYVNDEGEARCRCREQFQYSNDDSECTFLKTSYKISLPIRNELTAKKSYRTALLRAITQDAEVKISKEVRKKIEQSMRLFIPKTHQIEFLSISCSASGQILQCSVAVGSNDEIKDYINLINAPSTCVSENDNDTFCVLASGLVLKKSLLESSVATEITPCDENVNYCGPYTTCNKTSMYECTCMQGFTDYGTKFYKERNFMWRGCKDIDECQDQNVCPSNNTCVNTIGDYRCECAKGYRIAISSNDLKNTSCIGLCGPNPCKNGGKCAPNGDHFYNCKCLQGYIGPDCEDDDADLRETKLQANKTLVTNSAVIGAVLGTLLVITVIVSIIKIRSLKKKKQDNAFDIDRSGRPTEMSHLDRNPIHSRPGGGFRELQNDSLERELRTADTRARRDVREEELGGERDRRDGRRRPTENLEKGKALYSRRLNVEGDDDNDRMDVPYNSPGRSNPGYQRE